MSSTCMSLQWRHAARRHMRLLLLLLRAAFAVAAVVAAVSVRCVAASESIVARIFADASCAADLVGVLVFNVNYMSKNAHTSGKCKTDTIAALNSAAKFYTSNGGYNDNIYYPSSTLHVLASVENFHSCSKSGSFYFYLTCTTDSSPDPGLKFDTSFVLSRIYAGSACHTPVYQEYMPSTIGFQRSAPFTILADLNATIGAAACYNDVIYTRSISNVSASVSFNGQGGMVQSCLEYSSNSLNNTYFDNVCYAHPSLSLAGNVNYSAYVALTNSSWSSYLAHNATSGTYQVIDTGFHVRFADDDGFDSYTNAKTAPFFYISPFALYPVLVNDSIQQFVSFGKGISYLWWTIDLDYLSSVSSGATINIETDLRFSVFSNKTFSWSILNDTVYYSENNTIYLYIDTQPDDVSTYTVTYSPNALLLESASNGKPSTILLAWQKWLITTNTLLVSLIIIFYL